MIFLLGYGTYLIGASFQSLFWAGLYELESHHLIFYVGAIENTLMLIAMGLKIYTTESNYRSSYRNLQHTYNQLRKVFYQHQIEQVQQGIDLENTMPVHSSEGIIISFDIINSSKLKHYHMKDFLESSIRDCIYLLNEDYDPSQLSASGYRIKEMGDGFLCSIDYPFKVPEGERAPDLAVKLSYKFIEMLNKNVDKYHFEKPVFSGIGIAMGQLQGYYPSSGTKEYDLFGRGIVLATRYEAMRKKIFLDTKSHIIILQTDIYNSLSPDYKQAFKRYQLSSNLMVRDDSEAQDLYYYLIPYEAPLRIAA